MFFHTLNLILIFQIWKNVMFIQSEDSKDRVKGKKSNICSLETLAQIKRKENKSWQGSYIFQKYRWSEISGKILIIEIITYTWNKILLSHLLPDPFPPFLPPLPPPLPLLALPFSHPFSFPPSVHFSFYFQQLGVRPKEYVY